MASPRTMAMLAGASKYDGAPCRWCGGTVRLTSNANCVRGTGPHGGHAQPPDLAARVRAKAAGAGIYTSPKPCPRCGGTIRATRRGECVACLRARSSRVTVNPAGHPGPVLQPAKSCGESPDEAGRRPHHQAVRPTAAGIATGGPPLLEIPHA